MTNTVFDAVKTVAEWIRLRNGDFDFDPVVSAIKEMTDSSESEVRAVLDECLTGEPMALYRHQFDKSVGRISTTQAYRTVIGTSKYVGLMRISLYCIVRLLKPEIVVETGVKWGEGSLFILAALRENGHGQLHSFDIGYEGSRESYWFPPDQNQVGFFVPDELRDRWSLHIGDSLTEMPTVLSEIPAVDMFVHDSLHTYDHMYNEFDIALTHMTAGGILASEDIDANRAWDDILEEHADRVTISARFYAKQGVDESHKEVGVAAIDLF